MMNTTTSRWETLNFLLTNRVPRALLTRIMGRISNIESPMLTKLGIGLWQRFDKLDFAEAEADSFSSLQQCFTRKLKPGARPVDARQDVLVSPCDAIIGAHGAVENGNLFQIKDAPYRLSDLIPQGVLQDRFKNGRYVTLRLKSSMYHRFHAPCDCRVQEIAYISGDTWNVNPPALRRVANLFCKNERAVLCLETGFENESLVMVPVAAILVASMQLHALDQTLDLKYDGPNYLRCDASYNKGDEMGFFKQGSTIILFTTENFEFSEKVILGNQISMGQPLLTRVIEHGKEVSNGRKPEL